MKWLLLLLLTCFSQASFAQNDSILIYGQNLILKNKLDEGIFYYNKHIALTEDQVEKSRLLLDLGTIYKLKLDFEVAYEYYDRALEIINLTGNNQLKFSYHVKMIEFYRKRGLYAGAILQQESAEALLKNNNMSDVDLASYYGRRAALFNQHFGI
jgi:tetratricopeptide (TPR) repeat protein